MKASAKKSSTTTPTTATQAANQPFFAKTGSGNFFAPVTGAVAPDVQTKMKVGKPGDKFEQEADSMADKVMRMPALAPSPINEEKPQRQPEEKIQKAAIPEEQVQKQEEEEVQKAAEPEEQVQKQEEDKIQRVAVPEEQIQKQEVEEIQKAAMPEEKIQEKEEEKIQKAAIPEERVQKQEEEEIQKAAEPEEKLQKQEGDEEAQTKLQRMSNDEEVQAKLLRKPEERLQAKGTPHLSDDVEQKIQQMRGQGVPLAKDVQQEMENKIGADFSAVRIHNSNTAHDVSKQINARAFTLGYEIFFASGEYSPTTERGKKLLAHELTHVVQQGKASPVKGLNSASEPLIQKTASPIIQLQTAEAEAEAEIETEGEAGPSEQEKAAAKAAAIRAKNIALQAATLGRVEVVKSKQKKTEEKESQQKSKKEAEKASVKIKKKQEGKPKHKIKGVRKIGPISEGGEKDQAVGIKGGRQAPASPEEDPAFQSVIKKIVKVASKQRAHDPAETKADEAQKAAKSPPREIAGKAQTSQVAGMERAETPPFNAAAFTAQLMKRIEEAAPKTAGEADKFKQSNQLGAAKKEMQSTVAGEKTHSQSPVADATAVEPDTASVEPKPVTPIPEADPGAAPAIAGAGQATPKRKGKSEVEAPIQENSQRISVEMEKENITEEQLAKSNEPLFQGALESKRQAESQASAGPQAFRQGEQEQQAKAQSEATGVAMQRTQSMYGGRVGILQLVQGLQGQTKTKDELARDKVGQDIQKIYNDTKTSVNAILEALDGKVDTAFDEGAATAKQIFEDYVDASMEAYKQEHYGGWLGWARWGKDKLLGMPDAVNVFYEKGRSLYLSKMNAVIDNVVAIIGAELTAAKAEIAKGKKEIQTYVDQLPDNLKSVGAEAAESVNGQFDELEASVNNKQNELVDTLANKYRENLQTVDARIEEMKAANQGLVDKAVNAVAGVIKAIIEIRNLLITVLGKIANVVTDIIADPIGFLSNLISGLKQGFQDFVTNAAKHMQTGLVNWLTSSLGPLGIQMPEDLFSPKGIFSLVIQVLGLGWDFIRGKAVKLLGEPVVKFLESAFEPFRILLTEGIGGLWKYIKEQFTNLKEMVLEQIKEMVITQVIKAGIKWLLGLLNPASAFVKAAMTIYDIVKFFWERARQLGDFLNAITDAVAAVAKGAIGNAAKLVEESLAKALPLILGFLANLLGLGDLTGKVQNFLKSLRTKFSEAIDWLLLKAKKVAGRFFGRSDKGKKSLKEAEKGGGEVKLETAFAMAGEGHHIYVGTKNGKLNVEMATSYRTTLETLVASAIVRENKGAKRKQLIDGLENIESELKEVAYEWAAAQNKSDEEKRTRIQQRIIDIAGLLKVVGRQFGIKSLEVLGHPSVHVIGNQIRPQEAKRIRKVFYPSGYRDATMRAFCSKLKNIEDPNNPKNFIDEMTGESFPKITAVVRFKPTIDHKKKVVDHWESEGNNTTQMRRADWYNEIGNHQIVAWKNK